jgi:hypothetical protein
MRKMSFIKNNLFSWQGQNIGDNILREEIVCVSAVEVVVVNVVAAR